MRHYTRSGKLRLYFTGTTDFEDRSGEATRVAMKLMGEGVLQEDPNAGTPREFMPGGTGFHHVDELTCDHLLRCIWPDERWESASENKRNDVFHLLAHMRNGRDIFLSRDEELLKKRKVLKEKYQIFIMSPRELLLGVRQIK